MGNTARIDRTRFYEQFQRERAIFIDCIQGSQLECSQYASRMFNQLLFIYFVQKQGFLAGNVHYLSHKLQAMQQQQGENKFFSFYCTLLHHLFSHTTQKVSHTADDHLHAIPHLSGDLFSIHEQADNTRSIHIPDTAFEHIFTFFDSYQWCIDEQAQGAVIDPGIFGYLCERNINQKQAGAYYTHSDITRYMSQNIIIPYILQAVEQKCLGAFKLDGPLWRLLRISPECYINDTLQTSAYLPTETEREYSERHTRLARLKSELADGQVYSINQLISYNLDSTRFALDAIKECRDSALLRAFYESITAITVLDPTCGSGAFLFAALNVLEPLYAACLASMQRMLISTEQDLTTRTPDLALFRAVLEQVERHPDRSYFILKAITINNLYGVDIMPEAVEICKLRIFLKLVAQLKSIDDIEPLPDIDFNIRTGNTLVGFAHLAEVKKTILGGQQGKMDFDAALEDIERKAGLVERELTDFRGLQTRLDGAPNETRQRKPYLRDVQKQLCTALNRYLASQYGIGQRGILDPIAYEQAFTSWCASHQPFHWFIDFHAIMERGGFDVIIGNPPYVEYSKVRHAYRVQGYETASCGNLYAAVLERSLTLCRDEQSYLGLIVPLSVCGGERFDELRHAITRHTAALWLANFEIFPCRLFEGAFQRLSILLAQYGSHPDCAISSTRIQRWYAVERAQLIDLIAYTPARRVVKTDVFPKLASPLQESILRKLTDKARGGSIATTLYPRKTDYFIYYQEATNYWMKATCIIPYYKKNGVVMPPAHGRFLYFRDEETARAIMALMNSSLFYVWFATFSDGFHLSHTLVKEFPVERELFALKELPLLAGKLEQDIQAHARLSTRNTKPGPDKEGHLIELAEYRMSYSKGLLDEIDRVLAKHFGLSEEELDFVINYDIKYRMGQESGEQEEILWREMRQKGQDTV
jgi:Eco57I restriction-modification methylase